MAEERRVIFFSTETGRNQATLARLRDAGFATTVVSEQSLLMREVRNARDRVVVLDFQSKGTDGLELLREIKLLDSSIQILVINAEPKVFLGIQIFRAGGEACFFQPAQPGAELCEALDGAFQKIARWWRALHEVAAIRTSVEVAPPPGPASVGTVSGKAAANERRQANQYPVPGEEIEVATRGAQWKGKGKAMTSSSAGMHFMMPGDRTPALFESLTVHCRGLANRGIVRRVSNHPEGGWLVALEWSTMVGARSVPVGARAERALFVVLEGHRVVARALVAVSKDLLSARLATGQVHAVPTSAVCSLTSAERAAELAAAEDLSFFVEFYQLAPLAGLEAIVESIMAIEFAIGEDRP